jgi:hypothetical protein
MQDMLPPQGRSIRDIPVPPNHRRVRTSQEDEYEQHPPRRRRRGRGRFWIILLAVVIVCAAGGILLSTIFAGATVTVHARTASVTPPGTLTAQLNAPVGSLSYQPFSVSASATTTVAANGTQQVSIQASGVVTISNNYSTASQRLIANTRLEAPDGKIYRIHDSITVPGMSGGKAGTVTATVYADSPGADYNKSGTTTFTIPGFQGEPQYTKFSAQSQGDISGGFVGAQPAVAAGDLATAQQQLQTQLDQAVRAKANAIPDGYTAIPGSLNVTFSTVAQTPNGSNQANLSQTATASGDIVRTQDLANVIAEKEVQTYNGEAVGFDPSSTLNMMLASSSKPTDATLNLTLSGTAVLVWQFDPNALTQALIGKPKGQFETILQSFAPAIECSTDTPCSAAIRPFWQSSFPSDASKIKIVTK